MSSYMGVLLSWIGVSVGLWAAQRIRTRWKQREDRDVAAQALHFVNEAQAVFDAVRAGLPGYPAISLHGEGRDRVRDATTKLLRGLQSQSGYFDGAASLKRKVSIQIKTMDEQALAEILQIRRDLWAAAEVALVEDRQELGEAFAEEGAYELCFAEAISLLFKNARIEASQIENSEPASTGNGKCSRIREEDPIDRRLFLAREAAAKFANQIDDAISATERRERLPGGRELASAAPALARAVPPYWRAARQNLGAHCGVLARACRRQARLGKVISTEALSRAPAVWEKGRRLMARLELARRGRELKRTTREWFAGLPASGAFGSARRLLSHALARAVVSSEKLKPRAVPAKGRAEPEGAPGVRLTTRATHPAQGRHGTHAIRPADTIAETKRQRRA